MRRESDRYQASLARLQALKGMPFEACVSRASLWDEHYLLLTPGDIHADAPLPEATGGIYTPDRIHDMASLKARVCYLCWDYPMLVPVKLLPHPERDQLHLMFAGPAIPHPTHLQADQADSA